MLKRRLVDSLRHPLAWVLELKDHYTGDVILPLHVTYQPFDQKVLKKLKAEHNYQHVPLSSGQGIIGLVLLRTRLDFTDLAPRRLVLQREQGSPRTIDTKSDDSQLNFNWQSHQLLNSELIAYFIGSIIGCIFSVLIYRLLQFYSIRNVVIDNSWSIYFIFVFFNRIFKYSKIK